MTAQVVDLDEYRKNIEKLRKDLDILLGQIRLALQPVSIYLRKQQEEQDEWFKS